MIYEDIQVSGSISISGSFNVPKHASTASANQATGSLFFDTSAKLFKVFQSGAGALNVASQPFTPTPPAPKENIEYLVIGGGGSGGQLGGGGAGGHLSGSLANVTSGSSLTVTIGGGGAPITSVVRGNTGTDSSIAGTGYSTATALGGGGGGGQGGASDAGTGKDGGSGGGGGENDAGTNTPGSGTAGQGNDGGTGGTGAGVQLSGGGGGGAGAAGSNAAGQSSGGAGGNGLANNITGTSVTRAGGGGGGAWWYNNGGSSYGGAGGSGGGGAAGTTGNTAAVSGTANTGGGGGGAGFTSAGYWITDSGTGGSGVVVLAYPTGSVTGKGGIKTTRSDGQFVHTFNESGTFTLGGSSFMTVAPSENFNTVLYTGNSSTTNAISGVGFKPDLVWWKARTDTRSQNWSDSVRGAGKLLFSNNTDLEYSATDRFISFDNDGFTVGSSDNYVNNASHNYVAWCWKAGGTAVSNANGSITSTVSANQAAGFSIVKYTAGGTFVSEAVGHGLSSAPKLIIQKRTNSAVSNWYVLTTVIDGTVDYLILNSDAAKADVSGDYASFQIGNSTFSDWWGSSNEIINYCFHDVTGYQKIGTYTGNGSATGPTVTTGFKPAWILIKNVSTTKYWYIQDNKRSTSNPRNKELYPNRTDSEATMTALDFLSDGFQIKTSDSGYNTNTHTYIYLAISE